MARKGVMLAKPYSERLLQGWPPNFYIQPKINGLRCRAQTCPGQKAKLFSSEGNEIISMPHISAALSLWPTISHIDGELYKHGMPLQEIRSRVIRTAQLHIDYHSVQFHVFDLIDIDPQDVRLSKLDWEFNSWHEYSGYESCIQRVPTHPNQNASTISGRLQQYLNQGFEGIILRQPAAFYEATAPKHSRFLLKLKPRQEAVCQILGAFIAYTSDCYRLPKNTLGGLILSFNGKIFNCGAGKLTWDERQSLWDAYVKNPQALQEQRAHIYFQELSTSGVPQQPVLRYLSKENQ